MLSSFLPLAPYRRDPFMFNLAQCGTAPGGFGQMVYGFELRKFLALAYGNLLRSRSIVVECKTRVILRQLVEFRVVVKGLRY